LGRESNKRELQGGGGSFREGVAAKEKKKKVSLHK